MREVIIYTRKFEHALKVLLSDSSSKLDTPTLSADQGPIETVTDDVRFWGSSKNKAGPVGLRPCQYHYDDA